MHSISTAAPRASPALPTVIRAGGSVPMISEYASFIAAKVSMSAVGARALRQQLV